MRASVAMTASGAGARYKAWGARVQTLLIPLMIAGSVLGSGETVVLAQTPGQGAAMAPKGALKKLHPSRRTLARWKKHFEKYGEMPFETQANQRHEARRGRQRQYPRQRCARARLRGLPEHLRGRLGWLGG